MAHLQINNVVVILTKIRYVSRCLIILILSYFIIGCSKNEIKRLVEDENLDDFSYFIDYIDTANYVVYNETSAKSRFYITDSVLYFLSFQYCYSDTQNFLLVVKDGVIDICRSHESGPESFCTTGLIMVDLKINENIRNNGNVDFELLHCRSVVLNREYSADSIVNYNALWQGKKEGYWDIRDYFFYAEWDTKIDVLLHYHFRKRIECDTEYIFSKIKQ
jgi:hypothetical protein